MTKKQRKNMDGKFLGRKSANDEINVPIGLFNLH